MTAAGQAVIDTGAGRQDASGFVPVFEAYKRKIYQFAYQLTGNTEDAMDLMQEAFLRLHREWRRLPASRDPAPWLFTVVRNLALDLLRNRSAHRECEVDIEMKDLRAPGPEAAAMQNQVTERLWSEISRLPLPQREALLLRDWHGLSYSQIAEVIGCTVSTVTWRIHEARTTLRERMGRYL